MAITRAKLELWLPPKFGRLVELHERDNTKIPGADLEPNDLGPSQPLERAARAAHAENNTQGGRAPSANAAHAPRRRAAVSIAAMLATRAPLAARRPPATAPW